MPSTISTNRLLGFQAREPPPRLRQASLELGFLATLDLLENRDELGEGVAHVAPFLARFVRQVTRRAPRALQVNVINYYRTLATPRI